MQKYQRILSLEPLEPKVLLASLGGVEEAGGQNGGVVIGDQLCTWVQDAARNVQQSAFAASSSTDAAGTLDASVQGPIELSVRSASRADADNVADALADLFAAAQRDPNEAQVSSAWDSSSSLEHVTMANAIMANAIMANPVQSLPMGPIEGLRSQARVTVQRQGAVELSAQTTRSGVIAQAENAHPDDSQPVTTQFEATPSDQDQMDQDPSDDVQPGVVPSETVQSNPVQSNPVQSNPVQSHTTSRTESTSQSHVAEVTAGQVVLIQIRRRDRNVPEPSTEPNTADTAADTRQLTTGSGGSGGGSTSPLVQRDAGSSTGAQDLVPRSALNVGSMSDGIEFDAPRSITVPDLNSGTRAPTQRVSADRIAAEGTADEPTTPVAPADSSGTRSLSLRALSRLFLVASTPNDGIPAGLTSALGMTQDVVDRANLGVETGTSAADTLLEFDPVPEATPAATWAELVDATLASRRVG